LAQHSKLTSHDTNVHIPLQKFLVGFDAIVQLVLPDRPVANHHWLEFAGSVFINPQI
jgi:hypothetical protein